MRTNSKKHMTTKWKMLFYIYWIFRFNETWTITGDKNCLNMVDFVMKRALGIQTFPQAEIKVAELSIFFCPTCKISGHLVEFKEDTKNETDDKVNSSLLL